MTQYAGNDVTNVTGNIDGRYLYALRRTDQGELFFTKVIKLEVRIQNVDVVIRKTPNHQPHFLINNYYLHNKHNY